MSGAQLQLSVRGCWLNPGPPLPQNPIIKWNAGANHIAAWTNVPADTNLLIKPPLTDLIQAKVAYGRSLYECHPHLPRRLRQEQDQLLPESLVSFCMAGRNKSKGIIQIYFLCWYSSMGKGIAYFIISFYNNHGLPRNGKNTRLILEIYKQANLHFHQ